MWEKIAILVRAPPLKLGPENPLAFRGRSTSFRLQNERMMDDDDEGALMCVEGG